MSTKTVAVAAAALLSTLAVSAGSANAGGRHFHGFPNHHHHGLYLRIGPTYRDCSFYREMWEDTGSFKWKRRYYQCKGWW